MATRDSDQAPRPNGDADQAPVPVNPQVIAAYESMIASVPEAGQDGFERILEVIAQAGDVRDLDAAWRSRGLEELAGVPLTIRSIKKMPSDFDSGLPWFLVVEAVNEVTGEPVTVTTGAVSVVAQLVKAWSMGAFPLRARPVVAERPSKSGYYPQHLEILSQPLANAAGQAEPQATAAEA